MNEFVFIGTSPINLLKGYLIAKENPDSKVTFIDQHNRLGGAWYSDQSPEGHEIECGCHIWTYCPEVYTFIENELNIQMEVMHPSPLFNYKKVQLSYPLYTIKNSYQFIAKNSLKLKFSQIKDVKNNPEIYWKIFGKKNKYPTAGSPILIEKLKGLLDQFSTVEFKYGVQINEVVCADRVELKTDAGSIFCDQLFTTSVSSFKKISNTKDTLTLEHSQRDYIHILARSNKKPNYKVTYHRLINDPIIHRITDISYQTQNNEYLFLAGIMEDAFEKYSSSELTETLGKYLVKKKVIEKIEDVEFVKNHVFPTFYINREDRGKLEQFDERVHCFYSIDLMYGFYYILKEHKLI